MAEISTSVLVPRYFEVHMHFNANGAIIADAFFFFKNRFCFVFFYHQNLNLWGQLLQNMASCSRFIEL